MNENIDRRVLAGFVCVDAITNSSITAPLTVTTNQLVLRRNRSGVFAVMNVNANPALSALTDEFIAPAAGVIWPAPQNYEITIQDPTLKYLARRVMIAAPQPLPAASQTGTTTTTTNAPTTTAAANAATIPPVTSPQSVALYPTPAATLAPNWAVVRAAIVSNEAVPLQWAVVVITAGGKSTATGVTNENGETLLAVPGLGLNLSSSSSGSVVETTTTVTVTAWYDPTTSAQPQGWVSNPDDILQQLAATNPPLKSASQEIQLGPGQTVSVALTIPV